MSSVPVYAINTSCRSAECLRRWPANTAGQYKTKPPNLQKIETKTQQGKTRIAIIYTNRIMYCVCVCVFSTGFCVLTQGACMIRYRLHAAS